ncbi:MAG: hypothetical protein AAF202_05645 [Pseudomonadota bacterium]
MNRSSTVTFVFAVFLVLGSFMTYRSWNGTVYVFVDDGENRNPAAVKQNMDFSTLRGSDLSLASQKRILQEARVIQKSAQVGVQLGHFITRRANGKKAFACHMYQSVILKFQAEGVAENGETPEMEVSGSCKIGESVGRIAPIWIPARQILAEKPGNVELSFNEPYGVSFRFEHIGSAWPLVWNLTSVTLQSEQASQKLHISDQEMLNLLDEPLTVSWSMLRATASDK